MGDRDDDRDNIAHSDNGIGNIIGMGETLQHETLCFLFCFRIEANSLSTLRIKEDSWKS